MSQPVPVKVIDLDIRWHSEGWFAVRVNGVATCCAGKAANALGATLYRLYELGDLDGPVKINLTKSSSP